MFLDLLLYLLLSHFDAHAYLDNKLFLDLVGIEQEKNIAPKRINPNNLGVEVTAGNYIAVDLNSGVVLLNKDSVSARPLASITKLMTALVILDYSPQWDAEVEMNASDETFGAFAHIYRGENVKFIDLWKSALITSDNNAIKAMIRALGIDESDFVLVMNKKAKDLGMNSSTFVDPTGLKEENAASAEDIAKLISAAMQQNNIRDVVTQGKYSFQILNKKEIRTIYNTDILIDSFLNNKEYGYTLIGGKTGFLPEAGYCLGVEIEKYGRKIIIVVMNSPTIESRFQDVKVIADWVFTNYSWNK